MITPAKRVVDYVVAGADPDDMAELAVALGVSSNQINRVATPRRNGMRRKKRKMQRAARRRNR